MRLLFFSQYLWERQSPHKDLYHVSREFHRTQCGAGSFGDNVNSAHGGADASHFTRLKVMPGSQSLCIAGEYQISTTPSSSFHAGLRLSLLMTSRDNMRPVSEFNDTVHQSVVICSLTSYLSKFWWLLDFAKLARIMCLFQKGVCSYIVSFWANAITIAPL